MVSRELAQICQSRMMTGTCNASTVASMIRSGRSGTSSRDRTSMYSMTCPSTETSVNTSSGWRNVREGRGLP